MATEIFNRIENKYLLNEVQLNAIEMVLKENMTADSHSKDGAMYTITNVYYDTVDNNLIRVSLDKPKYKEKIRLRSYGVPTMDEEVFVEIKKKVNGLVNKRRTKLKLYEAEFFLKTNKLPVIKDYMNKQVLNEIAYFIEKNKISPSVYIAYDRKAYFGKDDNDLRLTIDTNIRTRRDDLSVALGDYGCQLLDKGMYLMEIKSSKSMPMWLVNILSEKNIHKTSFSKYGVEYKKLLKENMGVVNDHYHLETDYLFNLRKQVPCYN